MSSSTVEIGGLVNKDSTLGGFVMSNLDATAREIEAWFFNDYVPTWVKAAARKEGVFSSITASQCTGMPWE
jgi:hypothetical protein